MALSVKLYRKVSGRLSLIGTRALEGRRVSIGRGAECSLALDDPQKHISRVHVEIEEELGAYWLRVASKVNPVLAHGLRHPPGSRIKLQIGDRFELGEYEIEILPPEAPVRARSPLLDVLQAECAPPGPQEGAAPVENPPEISALAEHVPEIPAPGEVDFLLEPGERELDIPPAPAERVPEIPAPGEVDFLLDPGERELDIPPAPAAEARSPAPREPEAPAAEARSPEPREPEASEAEASSPAAAGPVARHDEVFSETTYLGETPPPAQGIFDEPTFVGAQPEEPQPGDQKSRQSLERALQAFLEGAGLTPRELASAEEIEQFLRQCGGIVRAAVEGVMALLAARAAAKKEFRADERTMLAARDNNPLKLMADPQEAIDFLFDIKEHGGGFLKPVQAVDDACEDLRAHEAALIAGMRAAILGTLRRFDPQALEAQLEKDSGGFSLNRKAKLWDRFCTYQEKLARDAEDDFNKVFGHDFMGSYMAQIRRLRGRK